MEINQAAIKALKQEEDFKFANRHPKSVAFHKRGLAVMPHGVPMSWQHSLYDHAPIWVDHASGSWFTCADGHTYSDFNIADMSMFCGYGSEPIINAVNNAMKRGNQFLLPTEDVIIVSEELGRRYGLPKWQYTSSASQANVEVIRVARVATGREKVLFFDGKYHGHFDEGLVGVDDNKKVVMEEAGLSVSVMGQSVIVPFNNLEAVKEALKRGDIALVLTEPALTNNIGLLLPDKDFHAELRKITREAGTLLCIDEAHTQVMGPGGLTKEWILDPDFITLGKSIAGGVPLGAWGMTNEMAEVMKGPKMIATGGTLFGNPLALAAARAALLEVLKPEAYAYTQRLGGELADGLRKIITQANLPWWVDRLGPRINIVFAPQPPRNATEARLCQNEPLSRLIRVWLANRGVWDAIVGAGPTVAVPTAQEDINIYLKSFEKLIGRLI